MNGEVKGAERPQSCNAMPMKNGPQSWQIMKGVQTFSAFEIKGSNEKAKIGPVDRRSMTFILSGKDHLRGIQ